MAAELIPAASTAANSPEFVLASGETATVGLRNVDTSAGPVVFVNVEVKDDGNNWQGVAQISNLGSPRVIDGPGTFRVRRPAGQNCGVYRA